MVCKRGNDATGIINPTLAVYDPVSNIWKTGTPEPFLRYGAVAAVINSKLFVAGGFTQGAITGTLNVYTPGENVTWSSGAPNVAMINSGGFAIGLSSGTSSILATSGGISGNTALTVLPSGAAYNHISGQLFGTGNVRLSFVGIAGSNYALERTFNLFQANWVSLVTKPARSDGLLVFTNTPKPNTNNFWRIRSVP